MASLTVQKRTRVSVPGYAAQTLAPGTVVQDTSPFYGPLLQDPWALQQGQFSPLDDMANIETWFDARYPFGFGGGLPANDGDNLQTWVELMGTPSLAQNTVASQPIWRNAGMNICPPLSDWTLSGGATYDPSTQQLSLPPNAIAQVVVLLPPYANNAQLGSWRFTVDHYCTEGGKTDTTKTGLFLSTASLLADGTTVGASNSKVLKSALSAWSSRTDNNCYDQRNNQMSVSGVIYQRVSLQNNSTYGTTAASILLRLPQLSIGPSLTVFNASTGLWARPDLYCPPCWDPQVVFASSTSFISSLGVAYTPSAGRTGDSVFLAATQLTYPMVNASNIIVLGDGTAGGTGFSRLTYTQSGNGFALNGTKGDAAVSINTITPDPVAGHLSAMHVNAYIASMSSVVTVLDGIASAAKATADTSTSHASRLGNSTTHDPFSVMAMIRTSDQKSSLDANELIGFLAARAGITANMATLV